METTGMETTDKQTTIPWCIPGMSLKHWFLVLALVLLFLALCAVVFAREPGQLSGECDLQSGVAATLKLSQAQCKNMRQLTDRLRDDTTIIRGKIMEKRLELKRLSENHKIDPCAINKVEQELNVLQR